VLISVLVVGVAGGGLKRPGDEALGVEGEGGSMFKMPRLDEVSVCNYDYYLSAIIRLAPHEVHTKTLQRKLRCLRTELSLAGYRSFAEYMPSLLI
jgi:hypothetical protein